MTAIQLKLATELHMYFLQGDMQCSLRLRCEWYGVAKLPFVFSHVEYCDMHFVYGFCNGNVCAAVEGY